MAWIECQQVFDENDPVECSPLLSAATGLCVYCDDIAEHAVALAECGGV